MMHLKPLMMEYGGFRKESVKAEEQKHAVHIGIGLGESGTDCLCTWKRKAKDRYQLPLCHTAFLGVDFSAKAVKQKEDLDECALTYEELVLLTPHAYQESDEKNLAFDWLNSAVQSSENHSRMRTRAAFFDAYEAFIERIKNIVEKALENTTQPEIYFHIISSLSDTSGSALYLDICYILRHFYPESKLLGYLFLPEVQLSRCPAELDTVSQKHFCNAYASMQELDFCMSFDLNDCGFTQLYPDGQNIAWNQAPFDLCHIISGDKDDCMSYRNAMHSTANYILEYTQSDQLRSMTDSAESLFHNSEHSKRIVSNVKYCMLNSSTIALPIQELQTMMSSMLIQKMYELHTKPEDTAALKLFYEAMHRNYQSDDITVLYDVFKELMDPAIQDIRLPQFSFDTNQMKQLILEAVQKRNKQLSDAMQIQMKADHPESLIHQLKELLRQSMCNIMQGPAYVTQLYSGSQKFTIHKVLDALMQENTTRRTQAEKGQKFIEENLIAHYPDMGDAVNKDPQFNRGITPQEGATHIWETYYKTLLDQCICNILQVYLIQLSYYVQSWNTALYHRIEYVERMLKEVSEHNLDALDVYDVHDNIIAYDEMTRMCAKKLETVNINEFYHTFMKLLMTQVENQKLNLFDVDVLCDWISACFENLLYVPMQSLIEELLRSQCPVDEIASQAVQFSDSWITKVMEDCEVQAECDELCAAMIYPKIVTHLHIPGNHVFRIAADLYQNQYLLPIDIEDHVESTHLCAIQLICGIPLCILKQMKQYESCYYRNQSNGMHLYEMADTDAFKDWARLPMLCPAMIDSAQGNEDNEAFMKQLHDSSLLFLRACANSVISYANWNIYDYTQAHRNQIDQVLKELADELQDCNPHQKLEIIRSYEIVLRKLQVIYPSEPVSAMPLMAKGSNRIALQSDLFALLPKHQKLARKILNYHDQIHDQIKEYLQMISA